ncbi:MAG: alpha-L-fucosidase [Clostridia bacterium]|nr:alpha-L-fucosidase [Clostridia bacterium]
MERIGAIIKKYRTAKKLTQEQLGKQMFVSKQAVSKWENDAAIPDLETLRRICTVLEIPSDVILQRVTTDLCVATAGNQTVQKEQGNMKKQTQIEAWRDYKFGMFIHYGIYSLIGRINEWVMFHEPIDIDDYAEESKKFTAERFDANYYADLAKRAGMKYMVLTTRHHDGFCLFDSKHSHRDFTVMNTPAQRDLVREYTDACRAAGLGVGLYYSPMDWRFEGYFFPLMYRKSASAMREQCHKQVRELMENYGKIDVLWYDGGEDGWFAHGINLNKWEPSRANTEVNYKQHPPIPEFWGEYELDAMVRERQPQIVINNRLGMQRCGDYVTPERVVGGFNIKEPWETCDTLSETWGWTPNRKILPLEKIVRLLIDVITGGGNLLLNISPRGDGSLDPAHEARLLEMGEWTSKYADAIYGTRGGPFKNAKGVGGFTCKDNRIFCFIEEKERTQLRIPLLDAKVQKVRCLSGEEILSTHVSDGILTVTLTSGAANGIASVTEITLDRDVATHYADFDHAAFDAWN